KGEIERPDAVVNFVWQTRAAPPSAYENRLGDALVECFAAGIEELEPLIARLNDMGVPSPDGARWTAASFEREMTRLGGWGGRRGTMAVSDQLAAAEERFNKGLLDYWYPVLPSWALHGAPVGITRLSQSIVLWRDPAGGIRALEDRCPHRGARLSLGWNLGDRIAWWYHGVQVTGDGVVADVPAVAQCQMKGMKRVRSYPAEERAGAIFVWFGANADAPAPPLALPDE